MRKYFLIVIIFFICACASQPIPQWKDASFRQLESYKMNFLVDKEDETQPHFVKAKKAASSSNDLNLLATLYLTKYALHTAALEDYDDTEFLRIDKLQPNPVNRTYHDFLKGDFTSLNKNNLPSDYSGLLPMIDSKDLIAATRRISSIADPLSRLIACGVWVKYLPYDENIMQIAIDTAAKNGWRRPLWAYLSKLQQYYSDRRETTKAESIRERLDLLKK